MRKIFPDSQFAVTIQRVPQTMIFTIEIIQYYTPYWGGGTKIQKNDEKVLLFRTKSGVLQILHDWIVSYKASLIVPSLQDHRESTLKKCHSQVTVLHVLATMAC